MKKINVGLIGLGTVGSGTYKTLLNFDNIYIKKIATKDLSKARDLANIDKNIITEDAYEIVNDKDIDIVIEVIGGTTFAYDFIKTAIENKKHIVTANKELLAKHGEELFNLATENNVIIMYEGAVGGGIPIIMPVKMALCANQISKIIAILNGTTNYILTKMEESNVSYQEVLKEAQMLGYAEANPSGDVDGYDSQYKITTLSTIAFNKRVKLENVYREGITNISARDMKYAKQLGYVIKLIALAQLNEKGEADVRVHPMLLKNSHPLANVNDVMNSVMIEGFPIGQVIFTGPGAGEFPTASAVAGDVIMLAKSIQQTNNPLPMMKCFHNEYANSINISETENKYYISIDAKDIPGIIGLIGKICGENNINISSLIQQELSEGKIAEIVVITGLSKEANVQSAIKDLNNNDCKVVNLIRVME